MQLFPKRFVGRKVLENVATPIWIKIFKFLKEIKRGVGGEYQLTDAINLLCQKEKFFAHKFNGDRFDTGNVQGYLEATIEFALRGESTRETMISIIKEKALNYNLSI